MIIVVALAGFIGLNLYVARTVTCDSATSSEALAYLTHGRGR